jgi:LCP family protein required for cell wall assembly
VHRRLGIAGTAWYAITCLLAALTLTASGFTYFVVRDVSSIGRSHAISSGPSIGAQNILLMGLESRRDWNGNILPARILAKLHAGNARAVANGTGGNATNTLILIHIFAGGKRAIGFSIPRDDWVTFADTAGPQQAGKIDQAYGVSMYYAQARLRLEYPAMGQDELAFLGNEAGRRAAVGTVEQLTGVHVDHFAEVNLDGFYELARVFGGVQVCLRHPVRDVRSGADFPAGYQHLDAAQALAFVRQRDGLPNGDLDRTHRQQAFLDSVMHQLRTEGVLGDLTKISALISVARQYVITDSGWNLLDFAAQARELSAGNMVFHTLPIKGYATIDGQDANVVDVGYMRALVRAAFYPPPQPARRQHGAGASPHGITVDVLNGGDTAGLAARTSAALARRGYRAGRVANTAYRASTAVLYGPGAAASAATLARLFGTTAAPAASVPVRHVEILLGVPAVLPPSLGSGAPPPQAIPTAGPQGGAVRAKGGIPCVN